MAEDNLEDALVKNDLFLTEKLVILGITIATAILYFIGWVYLYHYYIQFGLDIMEVNPSIQAVLVSSFFPGLRYSSIIIISILLLFLASLLIDRIFELSVSSWLRRHFLFSGLLGFFLLFSGAFLSAKGAGIANALAKLESHNGHQIAYLEMAPGYATCECLYRKTFMTKNADGLLHYLLTDERFIYLYLDGGQMIYTIPISDVKFMQVIP